MDLTLMDATAWTFALLGLLGFFLQEEENWGRLCFGSLVVLAIIQLLVLSDILRVDFLAGDLVLPAPLLLLALISFGASKTKVLPSLLVYAGLLQFLTQLGVIVHAG